ncbi:ADP-heptose--LPS heptosyltransferase 2 [mine drainage metagenome]|uniref:ADP-heptose--LPS heptosyltransferase 2 n=1 Tax=mine drainage metagenome TaxID=410659 RepID=A0A1J5RD22_9ZZZZ
MSASSSPSRPASVLVYVGLDFVGDGLMKLPFVQALRAAFPEARITWLAGKGKTVYAGSLAPLVSGLLDEVIEEAGIGSKWWELLRRPLPHRAFDLIIDTQSRVLTSLILKRIRHGRFISPAAGWHLSDARPGPGWSKPPALITRLLDLVELASGQPPGLPAPLPGDALLDAEAERRLPHGPVYVGLAPGAGGKHKCWPLEHYIALALRLAKSGKVPVVLLGPQEQQWDAEIRDAVPGVMLPLDALSPPMLTIALGKRLAAAVANDSGTGHMLAASGVPLISLFGPTAPEKFAPRARRLTVLRAQDYSPGDSMEGIPLQIVADTIERVLERGRGDA